MLTQAAGPTGAAASSTVTMGYGDSGDSPAFATTVAGAATSSAAYVSGLDGLLAATLTGSGGGPARRRGRPDHPPG